MPEIKVGSLVRTPQGEGVVDRQVWAHPSIPELVWLVHLDDIFFSFRESSLAVIAALKKTKVLKGTDAVSSDLVGTRWKHRKSGKIFKYAKLSLDGVVQLDLEGTPGFFYNIQSRNLESRYERVK